MPASTRKCAFTLLELIISAALLLMMLTGAYQALILARQYHLKLQDSTQIQQETMTVLSKLERTISAAAAGSLEVYDLDPSGVRFVSARNDSGVFDLDAAGKPRWVRWVGIYQENHDLILKDQPIPPTSTIPVFPDMDAIKANTTARRLVLTHQVKRILFEDGATTVSVSLETESSAQKSNGLRVLSRIHLSQ